jgi:hypothetical protein
MLREGHLLGCVHKRPWIIIGRDMNAYISGILHGSSKCYIHLAVAVLMLFISTMGEAVP